jgi:periplasmic protein TonB
MDPVRIGGPIREPRKVKDARPTYPESMRANRIQGVVILEAVISPTGKVVEVTVLRGIHPNLDAAAVKAVRKWEYTPTLFLGQPVPVIMTVTVNFRLN